MKIAKLVFLGLLGGTLAGACGGATDRTGSNSNWLTTCVADSDCTNGFQCICGSCTKPCASASDCSALSSAASCAAPVSTSVSCAATSRSCALACSKDADCAIAGAALTCSGARCQNTTSTPPADGGSHDGAWSSVCLSDADCGSGLRCFCGLCTAPCTATTDCTRFSALATCPTEYSMTSACVNSQVTFQGEGCAIVCTTDSDCASLGTNSVCTGGFCKAPVLVSHADGGVVTCEDRTAEMSPEVAAVFAGADRACKADADCTAMTLGNECYGDSCTQVAVAASGSASIAAQLSGIAQQYCGDFFQAGCVGPGLSGCPAEGVPTCVGGTCEIPPINVQGGGTTPPTCDDRTTQIEQAVGGYEASPGRSCTQDSDCAIQSLVSCEGGCGTLISKSGLADLAVELTDIEQTLCVPFVDAGCHTLALPCAFPGMPKCIANTCKAVIPGMPDAGTP